MRARVLMVLVGVFALSALGVIHAGISGSKHDFSGAAWNTAGGEICEPCHTPHNGGTGSGPLWNHTNTAATAASFGYYSNVTMQATDIGNPSPVSMACLGCHDGTIAMDAFGGSAGNAGNTMALLHPTKNIGSSVANDHPISFTYDNALYVADGELFDPATNTTIAGWLIGGKLECGSCHDVHGSPVGATNLLVVDNAASALCLSCHDK